MDDQNDFSSYGAKNASQDLKKAGQSLTRKMRTQMGIALKRNSRKIAKKAIKATAEALSKVFKVILQILVKALPILLAVFLVIMLLGALFDWMEEERGSSENMDLDPEVENPVTTAEDGHYVAAALTEPQALMDAYYRYLACNSIEKLYVTDSGTTKTIRFNNVDQTADYANLIDSNEIENQFYLSSAFIKMADEKLHENEFYYPEQVIKPVYNELLPLESDPTQKYITVLPLTDDGSDAAKALLEALRDDTEPTGIYAIEESSGVGEKRVLSDNASNILLTESYKYKPSNITTVEDEDGNTVTIPESEVYTSQSATEKESGVWDYGFGSVLQYEAMEKDVYMMITKISFNIHLDKSYYDAETDETTISCYGDRTIEVDLDSDTLESVKNKIFADYDPDNPTADYTVYEETDEDGNITRIEPVVYPSDSQISYMLNNKDHIFADIQAADQELAGSYYNDDDLHEVFGNANKTTEAAATSYPLKVPVVVAAATMSGNFRYEYEMKESSTSLSVASGTGSSLTENWTENCSTMTYASESEDHPDFTPTISRAGCIVTLEPSVKAEAGTSAATTPATETETSSDEESAEDETTTSTGTRYWVGDSRFVGLESYQSSNDVFIAEVGVGVDWLKSGNTELYNALSAGGGEGVVIIGLGVNDLNASGYITEIGNLMNAFPGYEYTIVSVTPVCDSKTTWVKNSAIETFNATVKSSFPSLYQDIYRDLLPLVNEGTTDSEGLHYTSAVQKQMYDLIAGNTKQGGSSSLTSDDASGNIMGAGATYAVPTGFAYIEAYCENYKCYVSDLVKNDNDFMDRAYQEQEGDYDASLDADADEKVTVMDFLLKMGLLKPYSGGSLTSVTMGAITGTLTSGHTQRELTAEEIAKMEELGCEGNTGEGEVYLLAKLIAGEAGLNKLDQLMVASVVVNRIHSSEFSQTSMVSVITAAGQYQAYSNGAVKNKIPTDEMISSARQVLSGEFSIPSNVIFQAAGSQGNGGLYMMTINPPHSNQKYCYNGTLSTVDIFGRTALTAEQARAQAQALHEQDIANGITSSSTAMAGEMGLTTDGSSTSTTIADVNSDYNLYATNLSISNALKNMRKVADKKEVGFLETIVSTVGSVIADIFDQIAGFFDAIGDAFGPIAKYNYVVPYNKAVEAGDVYAIVYETITFQKQITYSEAAELYDPNILTFLPVGEDLSSTSQEGTRIVNGTNSVFEDFQSPTSSYYNSTGKWTSSDGITIAAPDGTVLQAVSDGVVVSTEEVTDGDTTTYKVTTQYITNDGQTVILTYENMATLSVTEGASVSKGDQIGTAGTGGFVFKMLLDGSAKDPTGYFYRPSVSASAAAILEEAAKYLGTPYVWGGYSPSGFDCSGFVSWVFNHCGWDLGGKLGAKALWQICTTISAEEAQPGDLIFFYHTYPAPDPNAPTHVGIVVGNGQMIHCGKPCQYADYTKAGWQKYNPTFGRMPDP